MNEIIYVLCCKGNKHVVSFVDPGSCKLEDIRIDALKITSSYGLVDGGKIMLTAINPNNSCKVVLDSDSVFHTLLHLYKAMGEKIFEVSVQPMLFPELAGIESFLINGGVEIPQELQNSSGKQSIFEVGGCSGGKQTDIEVDGDALLSDCGEDDDGEFATQLGNEAILDALAGDLTEHQLVKTENNIAEQGFTNVAGLQDEQYSYSEEEADDEGEDNSEDDLCADGTNHNIKRCPLRPSVAKATRLQSQLQHSGPTEVSQGQSSTASGKRKRVAVATGSKKKKAYQGTSETFNNQSQLAAPHIPSQASDIPSQASTVTSRPII